MKTTQMYCRYTYIHDIYSYVYHISLFVKTTVTKTSYKLLTLTQAGLTFVGSDNHCLPMLEHTLCSLFQSNNQLHAES